MFDIAKLSNGLQVIGEKLDYVRSCSIGVWINVGSMNETPEENGLSHFIEHMVFKGTEKRTTREIAEETDMIGGQLDAFTSKECTCFYAKVTDDTLETAVDLLGDITLHARFDPEELNKERGVVLEEIGMTEDTPDDLVLEILNDVQYSGSLRLPILGPEARILSYTREDLLRFWEKHYTAGNMVLSIAGNYDWNAFLKLVEKYFDCFPSSANERLVSKPNHFCPGRAFREKEGEQVHICLGFPGVASGSDDGYPMSVFCNAIGGGMSCRLFQRIREELGLAYNVYAFPESYRDTGVFQVYAATGPENAATVIREIQGELCKVLENGITEKEFRSAKAQLRGGFLLGLESSSGRMQSLGRSRLILGNVRTNEEILEKIDSITMDDVSRIAHATLSGEFSAAVVGPKAGEFIGEFKSGKLI